MPMLYPINWFILSMILSFLLMTSNENNTKSNKMNMVSNNLLMLTSMKWKW